MKHSDRVLNALLLMYELHGGQQRKGSGIPYITHLLSAASMVAEYGGDEDQFIAALLHDAVEDQGGQETLDRIRADFGDRVAEFVRCCTDALERPKPPWRERKERYLEALRGDPPEVKLIVAADKLHNARSILRDLNREGPALWSLFRGGREGSLWYYRSLPEALGHGWENPLLEELRRTITELQLLDASFP